jgi:Domain of unknown function (DUF5668)
VIDVMEMEQESSRQFRFGAVAGGLIVLVVGGAMLLDSTGTFDIRMGRLIGPLVMIVIGATSLLNDGRIGSRSDTSVVDAPSSRAGRRGRHRRHRGFGGIWLIGIGSWMLVSQTHLFGLNFGNSWPLVVILAGVMIVIRGMR